jgi:hypothetical protein
MFSALTYEAADDAEKFRLSRHIDAILTEIARKGFGEIERVTVLYTILLRMDLDPFRTEWDQLAKDTQVSASAKLPEAIEASKGGLLRAVDFLREEGIWNRRLLPYSMQLVGLAGFFSKQTRPASEGQKRLLRRWLWATAFTEVFGGLNPSRILVQLTDLYKNIPEQQDPESVEGIDLDVPAHPFPERHDMRSARVRALLCAMLRRPVLTPTSQEIKPEQMAQDILERGPDSLVKVCFSVPKTGKTSLSSSPANRVFDVGEGTPAKKWILALGPRTSEEILRSHHISDEALQALVEGDHARFVTERSQTLMTLERAFMVEKGVKPPISNQAAASAIDVEDQAPLSETASTDPE